MNIKLAEIKNLASQALSKAGYSESEAQACVNHCLNAELSGKKSHGFVRIKKFIEYVEKGTVTIGTDDISIDKETDVSLLIDGKNKIGLYVVEKALEMGLKKCKKLGMVAVGVTNTAPLSGMIGNYARKSAESDVILIGFNNSSGGLVPHGAVDAIWGTNPITVGVPTFDIPVILDMAASTMTWGDLLVAEKEGTRLPENMAVDIEGNLVTDPAKALEGGLLPIAGPKGSGLGFIIELLAGALTKSRVGYTVKGGWGSFMILIDPETFRPLKEFKADVQTAIDELKNLKRAKGFDEIYFPGEQSQKLRQENLEKGEIEVSDEVLKDIKSLI